MDSTSAWDRVLDPATDTATLAKIARAEPEYRAVIAMHASADADLLAWLDDQDDAAVKCAVAARRAWQVASMPYRPSLIRDINSPANTSLARIIKAWAHEFSDGANDEDIDLWVRQSLDVFAPALLFGQEIEGLVMPPVLQPDEEIFDAWPCYMDDDPSQTPTPIGAKAKCRGFWRNGLMAVTADHLVIVHESGYSLLTTYHLPLNRIVEIAPVEFGFSTQLMGDAGDGFELFFGPSIKLLRRLLFRFGLSSIDLDLSPLVKPD